MSLKTPPEITTIIQPYSPYHQGGVLSLSLSQRKTVTQYDCWPRREQSPQVHIKHRQRCAYKFSYTKTSWKHAYKYIHTHMSISKYIHVDIHAYIHTYMHMDVLVCNACFPCSTCALSRACIHTQHTHKQTHEHLLIHIAVKRRNFYRVNSGKGGPSKLGSNFKTYLLQ